MIKAIVAGAAGKMGGRNIHMVHQAEGIKLAAAFERPGHPALGQDVGEVVGLGKMGIPVSEGLESVIKKADVIIDFTFHTSSAEHVALAAKHKKAIVVGTTGFTPEEMKEIKKLAKKVRCVLAPNMSVGVNVLYKVVQDVAAILGEGYDVEIIEAHHRLKKDAPSGTAVKLAQVLAGALGRDLDKVGVYARHGMIGQRTDEEIGIQTVRGGDIVGEHTVLFAGIGERIEVIHRAHSRDNFARGAVRAAKWIVNQKNGIYDMQDVLGLRK